MAGEEPAGGVGSALETPLVRFSGARVTTLAHTYGDLLWSGALLGTSPVSSHLTLNNSILQIWKQRPRQVK